MYYTTYFWILQLCSIPVLIIAMFFVAYKNLLGTLLCLGIYIFIATRYRCPQCGRTFDMRLFPQELKYCNHCGCDLEFTIFEFRKK